MYKTNTVSFRYFVDIPDGGRSLRTSRTTSSITHNSFGDMMGQISHIITSQINIHGAMCVQTSPSGQEVNDVSYEDVVADNGRLVVTITPVHIASIGAFWH